MTFLLQKRHSENPVANASGEISLWGNAYWRVTAFLACIVPFLITALAKLTGPDIIPKLTRDVTALGNMHPLNGAVSSIGCFLWLMSSAMLVFTGVVLRKSLRREDIRLLSFGAFVSAIMFFDDFFLLHEFLLVNHLGINEKLNIAMIGLCTSSYIFINTKAFKVARPALIYISILFLILSVVIDNIHYFFFKYSDDWVYLLEDGTKWMGIVFWTSFHFDLAASYFQRVLQQSQPISHNNRASSS